MARSSSSVSVSRAGGTGGRGIAYGGIPMNGIGGSTSGDPGINGTAVVFVAFKVEARAYTENVHMASDIKKCIGSPI